LVPLWREPIVVDHTSNAVALEHRVEGIAEYWDLTQQVRNAPNASPAVSVWATNRGYEG
jgi:hypothetical protein